MVLEFTYLCMQVVCDWGSEVCEKLVNVSAVVDAISGTAVAIAYALSSTSILKVSFFFFSFF